MNEVTAIKIALAHGIDPKRFRQALRDANLQWYRWGAPWTVVEGSDQHNDMLRVLVGLQYNRNMETFARADAPPSRRADSDEAYIIDLCDQTLGLCALRQHCFGFLLGDLDRKGRQRALPVDAWYPSIDLVVEYRERQHSESVPFFDRRMTVSGVGRGEQRRIYDERRRTTLPKYGISLIEFDFAEFHHRNGRLLRGPDDQTIIAGKLARVIK